MTADNDARKQYELDYRTQAAGLKTFVTNSNDQSVSFSAGSSTESVHYQPGDVVGNSYRLLRQIGQGGMGVVYEVEHLIIGQKYALKLLAPNQVTAGNWARFEIEGRALAKINHQNIVKIFNMGIDSSGCPFYVMDLLQGESLLDTMEAMPSPVPQKDALAIYQQVSAGLASAHRNGIVHRDVKPSNVMLTGDLRNNDSVKVVDFGIASMADGENEQTLTVAGEVFGSPFYMSPEQCQGDKVDARSDIYSLGASMFHTLTGKPPFVGKSSLETLTMHVAKLAPSLTSAGDGMAYPEALEQLVARMLLKNPAKRHQTMEQVMQDIDRIIAGKPIMAVVTDGNVESAPRLTGEINRPAYSRIAELNRNESGHRPDYGKIGDYEDDEGDGRDDDGQATSKQLLKWAPWVVSFVILLAIPAYFFASRQSAPVRLRHVELDTEITATAENATRHFYRQPLKDCSLTPNKTKIEKGKKMRLFEFPNSFSLGTIGWGKGFSIEKEASHNLLVPAETPLKFTIVTQINEYPAFLQKFADDMIVSVDLLKVPVHIGDVIRNLGNWKYLKALLVSNCEFQSGELLALDSLRNLRILCIKECEFHDKNDFVHLHCLDTIGGLTLSGQVCPDELMKRVASSKSIIYLCLEEAELTPNSFDILANNNHLQQLAIGNDALTDDDLAHISRIRNISILNIYATGYSRKGLLSIGSCKSLKHLFISSMTPWAPQDRALLQRSLPECRIEFEKKGPPARGFLQKVADPSYDADKDKESGE